MGKHTQGEWRVWPHCNPALDKWEVIDKEGFALPITEADATLIAAAPELLEVLKLALEHEHHKEGECGCGWTLKAESVIKKVEGRIGK